MDWQGILRSHPFPYVAISASNARRAHFLYTILLLHVALFCIMKIDAP